jgi:hypothetical protein
LISFQNVSFFQMFYAENFLKKRDFGVKKQSRTGRRRGQAVSESGKFGRKRVNF